MKVGLVGYAGSGKSTVFQWLTGEAPDPAKLRELDQAEFETVKRIQAGLEAGHSPREMSMRPEEEKLIRSYQLLTLKPEMVFVNRGDAAASLPADLLKLAPNAIGAPVQL